ncbi:hypothetical protein FHS18_005640 [Paenibacillus phyllosphaerae]|uniref:Uncharacterized protein n=1 Tax=Paenibacillus phyllosphaerae TaxID=274593 RepID=A0A7W5B396_9BACL|nr:hypothetical protein [Paenibacillus phyllosphaerae]MBB3113528.1 hypothetical protein [Paenibacillus phyllosphaerae]
MLSFEDKLAIISSFPQLERKDVSLGRINFGYEASLYDKKNVVYHLHPNGNGYIYAGLVEGAATDDKGFVNLRDLDAQAIRSLIEQSIQSLSVREEAPVVESKRKRKKKAKERLWNGPDNQTLTVKFEDELWYIFAGINLEAAFETIEEAHEYLAEEGFTPAE